ncbi:MAG: hypothetical protein H0X64_01590 [Gemmatimonadaceae bacterium]|nr:hypothetical protein [Gemmatimonadaceae bacterium]
MRGRGDVAAGITVVVIGALSVAFAAGLIDAPPLVRVAIVLTFVSIVPGYGWVQMLELDEPMMRWATTIGVSLSTTVLVALAMAVTGLWSPLLGATAIGGLGGVGVLLRLAQRARTRQFGRPQEYGT